jgi:outer membrane phospholipase A
MGMWKPKNINFSEYKIGGRHQWEGKWYKFTNDHRWHNYHTNVICVQSLLDIAAKYWC